MVSEGSKFVELRAKAGRFKLVRRDIERLSPDGRYRFVDEKDPSRPLVWEATRFDLERVFERAMNTESYKKGAFHQDPWPLADQFRISH